MKKVYTIALSGCGRFLYAGDINGYLFAWNLTENRLVKVFDPQSRHLSKIRQIRLILNDGTLLSISSDMTIKLWTNEFLSGVGKNKSQYEAGETQLAQETSRILMQGTDSLMELTELFLLCNQFRQPITQ